MLVEIAFGLIQDLYGKPQSPIVVGDKGVHYERVAAFPAQQIYSIQQLAQTVEGKIAYVDGDNDLRGSQQGIESQQTEIGRTVDNDEIVVISQAGKRRPQAVFPSFLSCKLLLRRTEDDFRRDKIQVI
jgi:hypothetical protein